MSARAFSLDAVRFDERGLVAVVAQDVVSGAVLMVAWADREALERTVASGEAWFWSRSRQALWRKGETSGNVLAVRSLFLDCDGDTVLLRVVPRGPACHLATRSCFEVPASSVPAGGADPIRPATADSIKPATAAAVPVAPADLGGTTAGDPDRAAATVSAELSSAPKAAAAPAAPWPTAQSPQSPPTGDPPPAPTLELGWLFDVLRARATVDPAESYTARLLARGLERVAQKVGEEATEVVIAALRQEQPKLVGEAADLLYHLLVLLLARGVEPGEVAAELARRHGITPTGPTAAGVTSAGLTAAGAAARDEPRVSSVVAPAVSTVGAPAVSTRLPTLGDGAIAPSAAESGSTLPSGDPR